jgi:hypothetical protein
VHSHILVLQTLEIQVRLSQYGVFYARLLAGLRMNVHSLLPALELWMIIPQSCALFLGRLLLRDAKVLLRVVGVLPIDPAPSFVTFHVSWLLPQ